MTNFENGQYGWAAANFGLMVGEQVLYVLTLGESGLGKQAGQCAVNATDQSVASGVNITERGLGHTLARHTVNGARTSGKSIFSAAEDVSALIRNAGSVPPIPQAGGNFVRVVDAGRVVGIDRATG